MTAVVTSYQLWAWWKFGHAKWWVQVQGSPGPISLTEDDKGAVLIDLTSDNGTDKTRVCCPFRFGIYNVFCYFSEIV